MSPENGQSDLQSPWPFLLVAMVVAAVAAGLGLGFLVLPRYQGGQAPSSVKEGVFQALGFHHDEKALSTVQPPLRVPTHVAWTEATVLSATSGDPKRGESIAESCTPCHVDQARSADPTIPYLGGMDRLATYKQLDDYRTGTRSSVLMSALVQSLTPEQCADVAAYFAAQAGLPHDGGRRMPRANSTYRNSDPVQRLVYAGDPKRGIAPCASCHGPGGYVIGAPALINQNALYLEQQLQAFAGGTRANDMNMPMRTIAASLTPDEMKSLASAYSTGLASSK